MCAMASTRKSFFGAEGICASIAKRATPDSRCQKQELGRLDFPFPGGLCLWTAPTPRYCLFGFSGLDFGSALGAAPFDAACFDSPCAPASAWEISSICVPLSRCTFLPADVMIEPCELFEAAEFRLRPFNPKTPRLFEVSCPAVFNPLAAPPATPLTEPAAFPATFAVELSAPPAVLPTFAAVCVTAP